MPTVVVMLLGRRIWTRETGAWRHEPYEDGPAGRLRQILSAGPPGRRVLVFEPEGIAHQAVETPDVGRSVFASLAKVRNEFPVVESETVGWGIEPPEPAQGGGYSTLIHSEMTPDLIELRESCAPSGARLDTAWTAYTAAAACARNGATAAKPRFILILAHDFIAIAVCTVGKRSFRAWAGPMSERDWKALSALIGDGDVRSSAAKSDPGQKRGAIAVIAEGEPKLLCPLWAEIQSSGRVSGVMDLDALAAAAAKIPRSHPANLMEAFPTPLDLNRYLHGALSVCLVSALVLCVLVVGYRRQIRAEASASRERAAGLQGRLAELDKNRMEMKRLQAEIPADAGLATVSRHDALVALSGEIPDPLTLASLNIRADGGFEIKAVIVGTGLDSGSLRKELERSGFETDSHEGWVLNAAAGRLEIRGKLGAPRT